MKKSPILRRIRTKAIIVIVLLAVELFLYFVTKVPTEEIVTSGDGTIRMREEDSQANEYENTENKLELFEWMDINRECRALLKADSREFPIVQTGDNEKYLNVSIYGGRDVYGVPFFDYRNNIEKDGHLIIYGHSTRSRDLLFTFVKNYRDEEYFREYPGVILEFPDGEHLFRVIGFNEVSSLSTDSQKYLRISFDSAEERISWARDCIKGMDRVYATSIGAEERFLSLITCNFDNDENRYILFLQEVDYE